MVEIHGRTTITPWLFYTGKAAGYGVWLAGVALLARLGGIHQTVGWGMDLAALAALMAGILLVVFSGFTLGRSLRIGLPSDETRLQTRGIYRLSRNPMYLGVHLITLAIMLATLKGWTILPGLYSFYVYHQIIKGEETFLEERFGEAYKTYKTSTRRYL